MINLGKFNRIRDTRNGKIFFVIGEVVYPGTDNGNYKWEIMDLYKKTSYVTSNDLLLHFDVLTPCTSYDNSETINQIIQRRQNA